METIKIMYAAVALCVVAGVFLRYIPRGAVPGVTGVYEPMLATALILLVTPFTEEHHLVILIPAFCIVFFDVLKQKDRGDLFLYGISFFLIALKYSMNQFPAFHSGFLSLFSMGKLFGIVILCILMIKVVNRYNKSPTKV